MANIEMIIDSIRVSLMNYQKVVILREKGTERYLPIWIGPAEADAITVKLQGVTPPRPLTHDFVCAIIKNLEGVVKSAVIDKLKDDCFYAKLIISSNKKEIEIDCRPSDALAVALRVGVPIFTDEKVLTKAGVMIDPDTGKPAKLSAEATPSLGEEMKKAPSRFESFSESAQDVLNQAENEAKRMNHNSIVTGHLLLALVKEINRATEVLKNLGIDLADIEVRIETSLSEQSNIEGEEAGLTPAVKKAIALSIEEAKRLGSGKVQPEHILVGLVRQTEGIAANLLKDSGVDTESIYIELIRLYTRPWHEEQSPSN